MRNLIAYFIKYWVSERVLMLVILAAGLIGLLSLRSNYFPETESKIIAIQVVYPGASPAEIEKGVVLKIEDNLKGLTGVERISSVSSENAGRINVEVMKGYDTDLIVQDVKNAVDRIGNFPDGMEEPAIYKVENLGTAITFAISGEGKTLKDLKIIAEEIENDIRGMEGISKVELGGFPEQEIEIALREDDLRAYNISPEQVASAVRRANVEVTGGIIKANSEELLIRAQPKEYYAEGLRGIVVKSQPDGRILLLEDVATVKDKWEDNPNRNYLNGKPAVVITVKNTIDEDILGITADIRDYIETFNASRSDVQASIIKDFSITLQQRIDLLVKNGGQGLVLVLIFLALFLNARLAFWVALSIPISFAGMFLLASLFGVTINVMSLFGMIIVIGILVDDGIVISENIYQHFERGKPSIQAAIDGTMEVLPAVFSAIITTVVAFSTFFFADGRLGDFATELAMVVIFTLAFSLIEGAFILPAHVAHSKALSKDRKPNRIEASMSKSLRYVRDKIYKPVLKVAIYYPFLSLTVFIFMFMAAIGMIKGGVVKGTFFPPIARDEIAIGLKMPSGTREETTMEWLQALEDATWAANEEIKAERPDGLDVVLAIEKIMGPSKHEGKLNVILLDSETREMRDLVIAGKIRKNAPPIPAEQVTFGAGSAFGKPVSVSLRSNDLEQLRGAKEDLEAALAKMSELKDIVDNDAVGLKEVNITLKEKAYLLGLTYMDVIGQVRQGFFGYEVQRLQRGLDEVKVWVRFDDEDRSSVGKLEDMRIRLANGSEYPLKEIADLDVKPGIVAINHLDGQREIKVEAEIGDPKASSTEILERVEMELLPPILEKYSGINYTFEGQAQQSKKTTASLQRTGPIILLTMLVIIILTFRSFSQAFIVFLTLPFGFIGVVMGNFAHDIQISLLSLFGIIALIGIMVNDSLVFIQAFNNNMKSGMKFKEALMETGLSRFRPIILTSVTTIAGLAPIILEKSFGAQFLIPMAIAVAYGLMIATLTTLILIPTFLVISNTLKVWVHWLFHGERPEEESVEPAVKEIKSESVQY